MVQSQVKAYEMEHGTIPTVQQLVDGKYIESNRCPNGKEIVITNEGDVLEGE